MKKLINSPDGVVQDALHGVEARRGVPEDVPVRVDRGWWRLRRHALSLRVGDTERQGTTTLVAMPIAVRSSRPAARGQGALDSGGDL